MSAWNLNARSFIEVAREVRAWPMAHTVRYLESVGAESVGYPADADASTRGVIDRENQARAVVAKFGAAWCSGTCDAAGRALEWLSERA